MEEGDVVDLFVDTDDEVEVLQEAVNQEDSGIYENIVEDSVSTSSASDEEADEDADEGSDAEDAVVEVVVDEGLAVDGVVVVGAEGDGVEEEVGEEVAEGVAEESDGQRIVRFASSEDEGGAEAVPRGSEFVEGSGGLFGFHSQCRVIRTCCAIIVQRIEILRCIRKNCEPGLETLAEAALDKFYRVSQDRKLLEVILKMWEEAGLRLSQIAAALLVAVNCRDPDAVTNPVMLDLDEVRGADMAGLAKHVWALEVCRGAVLLRDEIEGGKPSWMWWPDFEDGVWRGFMMAAGVVEGAPGRKRRINPFTHKPEWSIVYP